jgi:hypothetical protein
MLRKSELQWQGDSEMKVTVNGITIEGTPYEVTTFLRLNQLLPVQDEQGKHCAVLKPDALNLMIHKQAGKRLYQTRLI